jgi:tRNA pseudouridine38-40 synthase
MGPPEMDRTLSGATGPAVGMGGVGTGSRRVKLVVEYDGTDYCGFQIQPGCATVQGALERALAKVVQHPVRVSGASRTDAGVHALGQVVALDTINPLPLERLARATNEALPASVSVVSAEEAPAGFHPRYDAVGKEYVYRLATGPRVSPFAARWVWHLVASLDVAAMQQGADALVGRHDFGAFEAAGGVSRDPVRTVERLEWRGAEDGLELSVRGDGFLYMMVRNIVGTLVEVGLGRRAAGWAGEVLASRDRGQAGQTAPARGLCLVQVLY